jgi:imidazolonepropionase-like amidohydrolase
MGASSGCEGTFGVDRASRRFLRGVMTAGNWIPFCCLLGAVTFLGGCGRSPDLVHQPAARPASVLIRDATVLDTQTGTTTPHRDVLLVGDRIERVAAVGQASPPAGAQIIEGAGATVLPGLIDMHGHIGNNSAPSWVSAMPDPDRNLRAYLYCGVTTVLDPADLRTQAFARRAAVADGTLLGPHIFAAGPMITAPGGHPVAVLQSLAPWWIRWYLLPRIVAEVDSPAAARAAVDDIAALQPDVIKLAVDRIPDQAPRIRRDVLAAAVDAARQHGIRAVAHIGSTEDAVDAADAGVAAWAHGVYKERIPDDQIARLAGYGIPMVPTMVVFESYALVGQGPRASTALERETVDAETLRAFDTVPADNAAVVFFRPYLDMLREQRGAWRDNVRRLRAAGVTMLAGSDTQTGVFPGAGLHRELRLLTEAGLTPAETIRAATFDAARFLANGKEPDFGIIAAGKRADVLLVEGDPTADLDALARIRAVIKDGVPLERRPVNAG